MAFLECVISTDGATCNSKYEEVYTQNGKPPQRGNNGESQMMYTEKQGKTDELEYWRTMEVMATSVQEFFAPRNNVRGQRARLTSQEAVMHRRFLPSCEGNR